VLEDIRLRPDKKATPRIAWRSLVDSFVQIPMRIVISPSVFVEYLAMWRDSLRTIDEVASFVRHASSRGHVHSPDAPRGTTSKCGRGYPPVDILTVRILCC
jgi:hypothetical protein